MAPSLGNARRNRLGVNPFRICVFWMHFLAPPFKIEAFQPVRALVLIVVTTGIGYVLGCVFGLLWNRLHK
jgi:hypothetical protein